MLIMNKLWYFCLITLLHGRNQKIKWGCIRGGGLGLEVIKLEYSLRLKIKRDDWLLADILPIG